MDEENNELLNLLVEQNEILTTELRQLNQARNEMCASGQEDYIGIIRNKNIEIKQLQQQNKLMRKALEELDNKDNMAENYLLELERLAKGIHQTLQQLGGGDDN